MIRSVEACTHVYVCKLLDPCRPRCFLLHLEDRPRSAGCQQESVDSGMGGARRAMLDSPATCGQKAQEMMVFVREHYYLYICIYIIYTGTLTCMYEDVRQEWRAFICFSEHNGAHVARS